MPHFSDICVENCMTAKNILRRGCPCNCTEFLQSLDSVKKEVRTFFFFQGNQETKFPRLKSETEPQQSKFSGLRQSSQFLRIYQVNSEVIKIIWFEDGPSASNQIISNNQGVYCT